VRENQDTTETRRDLSPEHEQIIWGDDSFEFQMLAALTVELETNI
jgi:hypothetical protein